MRTSLCTSMWISILGLNRGREQILYKQTDIDSIMLVELAIACILQTGRAQYGQYKRQRTNSSCLPLLKGFLLYKLHLDFTRSSNVVTRAKVEKEGQYSQLVSSQIISKKLHSSSPFSLALLTNHLLDRLVYSDLYFIYLYLYTPVVFVSISIR